MSRSSSIDIRFYAPNQSCYEILQLWLDSDWHLNDFGNISFLPVGDDGSFEWVNLPYHEDNLTYVLDVLRTKQSLNELLGIHLQWKKTEIGGIFLLYPDKTFSFIANINRRILPDLMQITDVNWYLDKLLTPLLASDIKIETVTWSEHV